MIAQKGTHDELIKCDGTLSVKEKKLYRGR